MEDQRTVVRQHHTEHFPDTDIVDAVPLVHGDLSTPIAPRADSAKFHTVTRLPHASAAAAQGVRSTQDDPAAQAAPPGAPNMQTSPQPEFDGDAASTVRRVLIVDDNADSADAIALLLAADGHETAVAYNGAEAVRMADSLRPDVVVLDIGLPILSGHHVAKLIRAQAWGRDIMLIAVTGWGDGEDRRKSAEMGIDHHLVKPPDYDHLRRLVRDKRSTPR